MKAYTDLEQSKKLAEILPLESADMCFNIHNNTPPLMIPYSRFNDFLNMSTAPDFFIPCWSLSALLEQLDDTITCDDGREYFLSIYKEDSQYYLSYHDRWGSRYTEDIETDYYDDLVDACVEMIEKLHEQKLL